MRRLRLWLRGRWECFRGRHSRMVKAKHTMIWEGRLYKRLTVCCARCGYAISTERLPLTVPFRRRVP